VRKAKKLDVVDAAILKTLLLDSRTSFTAIAKTCKISVAAVKRRYERLRKEGIIAEEIMLVNPYSIGSKCIVDLGIATAVEDEEEILQFLRSKPYIPLSNGGFGRYNLQAFLVLPDIDALTWILGEIEANPKVTSIDSLIWADAVNMDYPENLIIKPVKAKNKPHRINLEFKRKELKLDDIDWQIAAILAHNARMPFRQIADHVGISTKNVICRYNKLKGNVFTKSTVSIDLSKIGYTAMAHVFLKVSNRSKLNETYNQIIQIPNLVVAIRLIGAYDIRALVAITDFEDIFELTEHFRKIKGVEKADTYLYRIFKKWPISLFAFLITHGKIVDEFRPMPLQLDKKST
jgi:Lrp/AsnC family transcriptional regulator, regulator for asnA, asnC and gidA